MFLYYKEWRCSVRAKRVLIKTGDVWSDQKMF